MELTVEQKKKISSIVEKKEKNIWDGYGYFYLSHSACDKYLNVINETFHRPTCKVRYPELYKNKKPSRIETVEIQATFHGSTGSPVRYGSVPRYLIEAEIPKIRTIYYLLKNIIQSKIFKKKLNFITQQRATSK